MPIAKTKNLPLARQMQHHADDAAELLKRLAHPARLLVLCLLVDGELAVNQLEQHVGLSQSALSQHLAVLREHGLVTTRREGSSVYYQVAAGPWLDVLKALYGHYCGAPAARKVSPPR
jgi:DNA-binding transcriptional ArsR family regulator